MLDNTPGEPHPEIRLQPFIRFWDTLNQLKRLADPKSKITPCIYLLENLASFLSDVSNFQTFPRLRSKRDDILNFAKQLEIVRDNPVVERASQESSNAPKERSVAGLQVSRRPGSARLGDEYAVKLWHFIDDVLELFNSEVIQYPIYLPEDAIRYNKFKSHEEWWHHDREVFDRYMPQVAQGCFIDAGKCLSFGMERAAVSLALQAVESTLRYYYNRHDCDPSDKYRAKKAWNNMMESLNKIKSMPSNIVAHLEFLAKIRNQVAHNRYRKIDDPEYTLSTCQYVANVLVKQTTVRQPLQLSVGLHPQFSFDAAVGTYLFNWYKDLPPFSEKMVYFDETIDRFEIVDQNYPGEKKYSKPIVEKVIDHLRMQDEQMESLTRLTEFCKNRQDEFQPGAFNKDPSHPDLADLFLGIRLKNDGDKKQTLVDSWAMFDAFLLNESLHSDDHQLVEVLNLKDAHRALNESPKVSTNLSVQADR